MLWISTNFAYLTAVIVVIIIAMVGLYVYTYSTANAWKIIQGPQGKQGPRGLVGPPGPPGKNGISLIVVCYINETISCHHLKHSPFNFTAP